MSLNNTKIIRMNGFLFFKSMKTFRIFCALNSCQLIQPFFVALQRRLKAEVHESRHRRARLINPSRETLLAINGMCRGNVLEPVSAACRRVSVGRKGHRADGSVLRNGQGRVADGMGGGTCRCDQESARTEKSLTNRGVFCLSGRPSVGCLPLSLFVVPYIAACLQRIA